MVTLRCVDANDTGIEIDFCYGYGGSIQVYKVVNGQSAGLKAVGLTEISNG